MKNIRRSLGLEQIYRLKRREEFTEVVTEDEDVPPEVPLRDYEMLHYDYVPKPTISLDPETSSDTSSHLGSPNGLGRVRNLLHKMKLSPLKTRQKKPSTFNATYINKIN